MPRLSPDRLPKYRKHKATGQALVTLDGKDHYLGKFNSAASKRAYDRLVSRWQQNGRTLPPADDPTIVELCAAFWRHAKTHYVKNGKPTDEQCGIRVCLKYLKTTYRDTLCSDFGPRDLKAIQQQMIDAGNSRSYINQNICRLKHIFKWGVANEYVPVDVHLRLTTVTGLAKGKTKAKECGPILPVPTETVNATLPHCSTVIADMVQLQRLTGMRPAEVCLIRPGDVNRSGEVWEYCPESHKTEHHDRGWVIMLGPKAQEVLLPYLLREESAYCFRPKRWRQTILARYESSTYRQAIHRACDKAFPAPENLEGVALKAWRSKHRWNPNQLRHSAATDIRREFGLEAAQVALGHSKADTTQIYAERDAGLGPYTRKPQS